MGDQAEFSDALRRLAQLWLQGETPALVAKYRSLLDSGKQAGFRFEVDWSGGKRRSYLPPSKAP